MINYILEINKLLNDNEFEQIYNMLYKESGYIFTALLEVSNVDFLHAVEKIPDFCFTGLSIKSLVIPDNITEIGNGAFTACIDLESLTIPTSIKYINGYCFGGAIKLKEIKYIGTIEDWNNIKKLDDWAYESSIEKIVCIDGEIPVNTGRY